MARDARDTREEEVVVNENGERIIYRDRPKKKRNPFLFGCLGLVLLMILFGACASMFSTDENTEEKSTEEATTEEKDQKEESTEEATTEEVEETTTEEVTTEAATTEKVTTEAPKKSVTREHEAALKAAENYLSIMPFSKAGLYNQLVSDAGDQYPPEAAKYAIDHVKTDYKKNALKAAKNYLEIMPMSNNELYDQLVSDAGDKYTPEEAQYAVDNIEK